MSNPTHFNDFLKNNESTPYLVQMLTSEQHQTIINLFNELYYTDVNLIVPEKLREAIVELKSSVSLTELYLLGLKTNS